MFDTDIAFFQWLSAAAPITALVPATHIVAGELPEEANIDAGESWITFRTQGGYSHSQITELVYPDFLVDCYAPTLVQARAIYRAVRDLVHGAERVQLAEAFVLFGLEHVIGHDLIEPGSGWPFVTSSFQVGMRPTA